MALPRDSPVRSSWAGITLLPWPRLRPIPHKPVSIPRAVCEWYKPDRRRSGRGSELPGVLSCSEPTGGAPCIALCRVCSGGGDVAVVGCGCCWGRRYFHLALCVGSALVSPACPGAEGQSQVEEEHLHAMLPSHSPIMRQQVAPGSSLKSLSRGSYWASRVQESLCHHPQPAPARRPRPHLPGPTSSSSLPSCLCCAPRSPAPLCPQRRFLS